MANTAGIYQPVVITGTNVAANVGEGVAVIVTTNRKIRKSPGSVVPCYGSAVGSGGEWKTVTGIEARMVTWTTTMTTTAVTMKIVTTMIIWIMTGVTKKTITCGGKFMS